MTRTISIGTTPGRVFDYLSEPTHLPDWAPGFASAVTHERGDVWRIQNAGGERRAAIRAARDQGVVDIVSPEAPDRGLFARVIPSPGGSELIFSLSFPPGTGRAQIEAQMETIEQELESVRRHVEM
jgi:hypothetical protein